MQRMQQIGVQTIHRKFGTKEQMQPSSYVPDVICLSVCLPQHRSLPYQHEAIAAKRIEQVRVKTKACNLQTDKLKRKLRNSKGGEHRSERNEITSSQLTDTGEFNKD